MKTGIILLILLFFRHTSYAQTQASATIDSLVTVLKTSAEDTSKVKVLNELAAEKTGLGDYKEAGKYAGEALALAEKIDFKIGAAVAYNGMGRIYLLLSEFSKALDHYQKGLSIMEQLGNKNGMATNFLGIGLVYYYLGDPSTALEYYQKALSQYVQAGDKIGSANCFSNIGYVFSDLADYPKALEYQHKALAVYEQLGAKGLVSSALIGIGYTYMGLSDDAKALIYFQKALKIGEELGNKNVIAAMLNRIGFSYFKKGDTREALKYISRALALSLKMGNTEYAAESYGYLSAIDSAMNNFKGAYENHKLYMEYNDSVFSMEKGKELTRVQMNYQFDKSQDSAKAEQAKKDAVAVKELQKQKLVRNTFVGGFAIMMLFAGVFFTQRNAIKKGKQRSDELLLNILPSETAEELKATGTAEAKDFDEVTVMFTDFKNFTQASEKLSATELVKEIHHCYSEFDKIITKHGLEKIKTIGDSYMCAGGLPVPSKTSAEDIVKAAVEICDFMEREKQKGETEGKPYFEIRIGCHTGPVVAGIVGIKKFAYDIWGDTVNIASRMETSGEAGKVNISGATYELVKDKFKCEHRGKIQAKNKGEIDMYFVETKV